MSDQTKTESPAIELNPEAGTLGAAAAASAESAEILNLLGDQNEQSDQGGQCCGGACCSA